MRQKNFNFYEESTRVPLVYSNPRLFKKAQTSDALVSHVDFLPTLASLIGAPAAARDAWQGIDYSDQILGRNRRERRRTTPSSPTTTGSPASRKGPYPQAPNHIVSIRERRYKLARYYDVAGKVPDQWEMYDLKPTRSSASTSPTRATSARPDQAAARVQTAAAQARRGRADAAAATPRSLRYHRGRQGGLTITVVDRFEVIAWTVKSAACG